ncbi:MAG: right-handed parallel beta-helix repeat-containing protein [Pseudoxanthomonas sp.]
MLLVAALFFSGHASATTYYVRTDGGTAAQCTGKEYKAYPGSGSNQACAWKHPNYALPPNGSARIAGGDTLIIGPGEYMLGWGSPGAADVSGRCGSDSRYDCYLPPIPSGTATTKTRIVGASDDGCSTPPRLWGTERVSALINLIGSSNVEIGNLELTDKSDCVEFHSNSTAKCTRDTMPYGNWAGLGITAKNSSNVYLHDLNIHGLANRGIYAGGLSNWTLERVKIIGNGWAGWDGDVGTGSSNSGQILMRNVEIAWNGCGERWQTGEPWACWAQEGSGYGDGLGTAKSGGQWVIEDSYVHHNTSDGIDLLYLDGASTTSATIRRTKAEGNAGNQIKTNGTALIENSIVVGNCSYFNGKYYMQDGDQCRALGNSLSIGLASGQTATIRHNTITGEGDCLILTGGGSSASKVQIQNNALLGKLDWRSNKQGNAGELACGHYADNSSASVTFSGNLFYNVKSSQCPSGSICGKDPQVTNAAMEGFDATPLSGSPLIDAAVASDVTTDYWGNVRPYGSASDIGAIEAGSRPQ